MVTKFNYGFSKEIDCSCWKHLVNVNLWGGPYASVKDNFLKFMTANYGKQDKRYNIRWTDYGVDIRFRSDADAGSFI